MLNLLPRPRLAALALAATLLATGLADAADLKVYHIGNSITDSLGYDPKKVGDERFKTGNYGQLNLWAQSRGNSYSYGRHIIPGAPIQYLWEHAANDKEVVTPYPEVKTDLRAKTWSAVTLQPTDRSLNSDKGFIQKFIDETHVNPANADTVFYLIAWWPRREEAAGGGYKPFDYQAKWDLPYTNTNSSSNARTRSYNEQLIQAVRAANNDQGERIRMIPVGEVMYQLDKKIKAGEIEGLTSVEEFYKDESHFSTEIGRLVFAATVYATLYADNPVGLDGRVYGMTTAQQPLANAIQQVAWDTVRTNAYAWDPNQTPVPEPAAAAVILGAGLAMMTARVR